MKKIVTLLYSIRLCLLSIGFLATLALPAQAQYLEFHSEFQDKFEYPREADAQEYPLGKGIGRYAFSGTINGGDEDAFKVVVPAGYKVTTVTLEASFGSQKPERGTISFAEGAPGYSAVDLSGGSKEVDQVGDLRPGTYIGKISMDGIKSGSWTIVVKLDKLCDEPDVPTISVTRATICTRSSTTLSIAGGKLNDATAWKWYTGSCGGTLVGTGSLLTVSPTATTMYYVRGEGGCATPGTCASQQITVNPLPIVSFTTGLATAYCKDAAAVTLAGTGLPTGGNFAIDGMAATQFIPMDLLVGNRSVLYTYTDANGCTNTATRSVRVKAVPPTPTLLTQRGQSYTGGQSSVSVDLNTGAVNLLVDGCTGTINWSGPDNAAGTTATLSAPTTRPGTFVYQATCTSDGCTSPPTSATVKVSAYLTVTHRDVDNNADNNAVKPLLLLQNQGAGALPLSAITLRYYLTVENAATLGNLFMDYAQVGNGNVKLRYVAPAQAGGQGYVAYSFTAEAGSLATGASSGNIQSYFAKADYSGLNELDDYSYATVRDRLMVNPHITAYYNGILIAGVEPGTTSTLPVLRALTESKNGASATQINTYLVVQNEGTVPVNYRDLTVRYYFTAEGSAPLNVELDYAQVGEANVRTQIVRINPPLSNADTYLELSFLNAGQLAAGASTGQIRYRIGKADYGRFNQANDYSYQEFPSESTSNRRVAVFVAGERVWGTEPVNSSSARLSSAEPGSQLEVTVLGNPVQHEVVSVQIKGAGAEALQLRLINARGQVITSRQVAAPQAVEQHEMSVRGQGVGTLLLQVSTPTKSQTIRVLKAE